MSRMKLSVTLIGQDPIQVTVLPKAEVMVEQKFDVGLPSLKDNGRATYFYALGWAAMTCAKRYHKSYEDFLDELEDVDPIEEKEPSKDDDGIDYPTKSGLQLDSSSS